MNQPLAALDADDLGRRPGLAEPVQQWLRAHNLDPDRIHRIEIHVLDAPLIRVFEFAHDPQGRIYCPLDHAHTPPDGCEAARRDPYDVPLTANPPAALYPKELV